MNIRKLACDLLLKWEDSSWFASDLLEDCGQKHQLAAQDRSLLHEMVYGVLRWRPWLDQCIARCLTNPNQRLDMCVQILLRLGVYQMDMLDRIPDYAAIDQTVAVLRDRTKRGFVNAVLRRWGRESKDKKKPLPQEGFSLWVQEHFAQEFPDQDLTSLWQAMQSKPVMYARWNPGKGSQDDLEKCWQDECVAGTLMNPELGLYSLTSIEGLTQWPSFQQGLFVIQDVHAARVVAHMDVEADHQVLDACAAPGGKTFQITSYVRDASQVVALDLKKKRLERLSEAAKRLGFPAVRTVCADASSWMTEERFDRILLDAPCSNLGVLNRRLDVRYRFSKKQQEALIATQRKLLLSMIDLLKPGGRLVYSTCTLARLENQDQVTWLLEHYPGATCLEAHLHLPGDGLGDGGYVAVVQV